MSDDLTPSFQEPPDSGRDEAAGEPEVKVDPFDLNDWCDEGDLILGFVGSIKFLCADGKMKVANVQVYLDDFEALGMHQRAQSDINNRIDLESFVFNHEGDEEE